MSGRRGLGLQWQMLAGFLIGLVAGLIVYTAARGAPWVEAAGVLGRWE